MEIEAYFCIEQIFALRFTVIKQKYLSEERMMTRRSAILLVVLLCVSGKLFCAPSVLKPVKRIGVGRDPEKWGWMSFVAFNRDGTMIASDGSTTPTDDSMHLSFWSFPEGKLTQQFPIQPVALSNDWRFFVSAHGIGEIGTNKWLTSSGKNAYAAFAFSPDSRYAAQAVSSKGLVKSRIRVISLSNGKEISSFGRHQPFSISISPDGTTLASGYWNVIMLWNMFSGERIAEFQGLDRYIESLSFSPDGKLLAAGNDLGGLELWNVESHTRIWSLNLTGLQVSQPAFSPDGKLVAVGIYGTGTVWLVDVQTGKLLDHQKVSDLGCGSVAFSPDGRYLITPSTGDLIHWRYDKGGTVRVFEVGAP